MAEGKTYNIPASRFEWLKNKIAGLQKRIEKLGLDEKCYAVAVGKHFVDGPAKTKIEIVETFISVPEVRIPGYQFIGAIDFDLEGGNLIREVPGETIPQHYRHTDSYCDHCNMNRRRKSTYILRCDDGSYKQVGSSCIRDFTGHANADEIASLANLLSQIDNIVRVARDQNSDSGLSYYDMQYIAELAAQAILDGGFISRSAAGYGGAATADIVRASLSRPSTRSQDAIELAKNAIEWARSIDPETASNWAHNARIICNSEAVSFNHIPLLVSVVGVFQRNAAEKASEKTSEKSNEFIGNVGDKVTVNNVIVKDFKETDYGWMYAFEDEPGNRIVWFASKRLTDVKVGDKIERITFKVKKHNEFRGRNSTVVTHVKVG